MPIYDRPARVLMGEWARRNVGAGEVFEKAAPVRWFAEHYPKIKSNTVGMHVESMAVNNPLRRHFPAAHQGSGHDLFFKVGSGRFRLWDEERDPAPRYKVDFDAAGVAEGGLDAGVEEGDFDESGPADGAEPAVGSTAFALERDLRNYLERTLHVIEPGLEVYDDDEGIRGVEFPVGGRFIDILGRDRDGGYVVIELKVSRGYDRVIGQLLRSMGWVKRNMGASGPVRGVIVANAIGEDLRLAAADIPHVRLIEYALSFSLSPVD